MAMSYTHTDQMNRKVQIEFPPKRIVSLVPSQTELLHYLGLEDEVIGITKFCVHPDNWFKEKTKIGGTKQLNFEKINSLNPDLIIGNKEENDRNQIEYITTRFPVWLSDIQTIQQALQAIVMIGKLIGKEEKAIQLVNEIELKKVELSNTVNYFQPKKTAYFIWNNPLMSVNQHTFIHDMMSVCGLQNVFSQHTNRYPEVSLSVLKENQPEVLLLSSEPYPFKEKHIHYFRENLPDSSVILVDGEMFSWYGSRMLQAFDYLKTLSQKINKEMSV